MSNIVYREWVPVGTFVKVLVGFIVSLILCVQTLLIFASYALQNPFWIFILMSVLGFILFLFWNYRGIRIQLRDEELLVDYGIVNKKSISYNDIVSCEPTKTSFRRYGGVGVRLGWDGSWAYTTSFEDAVRITQHRGRPFVFSSNNPEKICDIIKQIKK